MKRYIQPTSETMILQMESVIASSININDQGTDAEALGNEMGGWNSEDWSGSEDEDINVE